MKGLSVGFPGLEKFKVILFSYAQRSSYFEINTDPLSTCILFGIKYDKLLIHSGHEQHLFILMIVQVKPNVIVPVALAAHCAIREPIPVEKAKIKMEFLPGITNNSVCVF